MNRRTSGFTLTETLLAAVVLLSAVAFFATLSAQSARTVSEAQLSTYAADAVDAAAQAIQQGNPAFTLSRELTEADLALLANQAGKRRDLRAALSGSITALATDPPTYRITVAGTGFNLTATATGPGGTP